MRKKKKISILLILITWGGFIIFSAIDYMREKDYNDYRCKTKKAEIIGIISWVNNKTNYSQIRIKNNDKTYSFDIKEIEYRKGFPKWVSYKIGDSIIKEANSKKIKVKRGDDYAIYILDCDD